ncbi:MAG: molybdopterin-guanine dinucleotide biosynthesis protein B [Lachnospiraceae bacterium]|jgi:molybdopterin-guanine dinucleotide biosynthesis protein MobB
MKEINQEYSFLLLAGGKSSRMGQDKGSLLYKGRSFVDTLLCKGEQAGLHTFFLSGHSCSREDVRIVPDEYKECGPLGGLQACMKVMKTPYCLVAPVDVPQIPVSVLKELLRVHRSMREMELQDQVLILKHEEREEPLIGIYPTNLEKKIADHLSGKKYSVFGLLREVGYQTAEIPTDAWRTDNINTPEAYRKLLEVSGCEQETKKPYILAVSGVKNSGKTTFLTKLIPALTEKGYRVAVIKHDGHDFQPDVEGTDSYRMREAGAYGCGIFSSGKWMVIKEEPHVSEIQLMEAFPEADIILLEGFKGSDYPKFEIVRSGISEMPVCKAETLLAVVTDVKTIPEGMLTVGLDDISSCIEILEKAWKKSNDAEERRNRI